MWKSGPYLRGAGPQLHPRPAREREPRVDVGPVLRAPLARRRLVHRAQRADEAREVVARERAQLAPHVEARRAEVAAAHRPRAARRRRVRLEQRHVERADDRALQRRVAALGVERERAVGLRDEPAHALAAAVVAAVVDDGDAARLVRLEHVRVAVQRERVVRELAVLVAHRVRERRRRRRARGRRGRRRVERRRRSARPPAEHGRRRRAERRKEQHRVPSRSGPRRGTGGGAALGHAAVAHVMSYSI